MANEKFYLDLDGLKAYNTKIKKFITNNSLTEADVTTLITNNTKTLSTQVGTNTAAIATIVGEDASKSMRTVASEEVAKIVAGADKDFDTLKEIADWIIAHPDSVAAIKTSLGTIEEGSNTADLIKGLDTRTTTIENTADSSDKIATTAFVHNFIDSTKLQDNIKTLIGNDANKSERVIANEELTKQLIPDNAQEALDTLQEIAEWIQNHPNDVATINKNIQNLKALIGTIPESSKADNIVDYVQECVNSLRDEFYSYLTTITQSGKTLTITGPQC